MSNPKGVTKTRSDAEIELRQERVISLFLKGMSQRAIAIHLNSTLPTVQADIANVRKRWRDSARDAIGERQLLELARIDNLEAEAWAEWERSKADVSLVTTRVEALPPLAPGKKKGDKDKGKVSPSPMVTVKHVTETKQVGRLGNEAYLGRVAWCIEMRCKILGLVKPETIRTNTVVQVDWSSLIGKPADLDEPDKLEARIASILPPEGAPPADHVEPVPHGSIIYSPQEE